MPYRDPPRITRKWVESRTAGIAVEFSIEEYAAELVRVVRERVRSGKL